MKVATKQTKTLKPFISVGSTLVSLRDLRVNHSLGIGSKTSDFHSSRQRKRKGKRDHEFEA